MNWDRVDPKREKKIEASMEADGKSEMNLFFPCKGLSEFHFFSLGKYPNLCNNRISKV